MFWGCSIEIDRSETTSANDDKKNSENLLPETSSQTEQEYTDQTYLELSIENDNELKMGQEAVDLVDYKMQVRLYDIRCLQGYSSYQSKSEGWTPQEDCLVFAKTIVSPTESSLRLKEAPYGVYFLDLRIFDPSNQIVANGSDEVVIVRDARNESKILVRGDDSGLNDEDNDISSSASTSVQAD